MRLLKQPLLWMTTLLAALSMAVLPVAGQGRSGAPIAPPNVPAGVSRSSEPIPGVSQSPTDSISAMMASDAMQVGPPLDGISQEDCGAWTETGAKSATVSTVRLGVPGKARSAYQKACGEFKKKKLSDAERDAQKIVTDFPKFPAAWVLLGESQYYEERMDPAKDACTQASTVDPTYVSPYLCLAAIADSQQDWSNTGDIADKALGVSPLQNPYGLYFKADSTYHLGQYKKAESLALSALSADTTHQIPDIQFLLARIYHAMENFTAAEAQLRDYLKLEHQSNDADAVKTLMARIGAAEISK
jgi:tetratricopeptide (TPR) repeat protein